MKCELTPTKVLCTLKFSATCLHFSLAVCLYFSSAICLHFYEQCLYIFISYLFTFSSAVSLYFHQLLVYKFSSAICLHFHQLFVYIFISYVFTFLISCLFTLLSGGWIEGYYSHGVPHGYMREFGIKESTYGRHLLRFVGRFFRGIARGFCWKETFGGGFLCGFVDSVDGSFSGSDIGTNKYALKI